MRRFALPLAVLVLLAGAYTVFWFVVAGRAQDWIAEWAAEAPDKDWHGSFETAEVTGYPFDLKVRITAPEVVWRDGDSETVWSGPWLVANYRPWNLNRIAFELPEVQEVWITEGRWRRHLTIATAEAFGDLEIAGGKARRLNAEFRAMVATDDALDQPVTADRLLVIAETAADGGHRDLFVEAENLTFPARLPAPFEGKVPFAAASLSLKGDVPSGGPIRERLASWRDAGGTLEVTSLKVDWPPLKAEADGTVALDEAFRPLGAFSTAITGYDALLDALVDGGQVARNEASMAKTVLDVMAKRDEATGEPRIEVPVTIQNGTLFVGPVPLMPVPPVVPPDLAL